MKADQRIPRNQMRDPADLMSSSVGRRRVDGLQSSAEERQAPQNSSRPASRTLFARSAVPLFEAPGSSASKMGPRIDRRIN